MRAISHLMWVAIWAGWFAVGGFIWAGITGMRDASLPPLAASVSSGSYVGVDNYVYAVASVQHPEAQSDPPGLLTIVMASAVGRIETIWGNLSASQSAVVRRLRVAPASSSHQAASRAPTSRIPVSPEAVSVARIV